MAENTAGNGSVKSAKDEEKAAKKAKQDRIKQNKPKKDGTVFSRAGTSVKKYWKDFIGTIKKIVWPSGNQVIKNSLVVLVTILVIGLVVFGIDQGLTFVISKGTDGVIALGSMSASDDETTEAAEELPTEAAEITTVEAAEETTAAGEEITSEAADETTAEAEEQTVEETSAAAETTEATTAA